MHRLRSPRAHVHMCIFLHQLQLHTPCAFTQCAFIDSMCAFIECMCVCRANVQWERPCAFTQCAFIDSMCAFIECVCVYRANVQWERPCVFSEAMWTGTACPTVAQDACSVIRVGQNRIYTPYMTVYLVISLPKIPYIHRIYIYGSGQPYLLPITQNYALRLATEVAMKK